MLHNSPPLKVGINTLEDARLYYRISGKGPPALNLPRPDESEWLAKNFTIPYATPQEILNAN